MIKRYNYRIYPDPEQEVFFQKNFGACRFIYNWALGLKIEEYESIKKWEEENPAPYPRVDLKERIKKLKKEKPEGWQVTIEAEQSLFDRLNAEWKKGKPSTLSGFDLSKKLTELKKDPELFWLKEVNSVSLIHAINHLDTAFKNFFSRVKKGDTPGFPKFKSKHRSQKAFSFHQSYEIVQEDGLIHMPKLFNGVRTVFHRNIPTGAECKTVTIKQEPSGKYFVSIVVNTPDTRPEQVELDHNKLLGVDHGVVNTITLSNGIQLQMNPDLAANYKKLIRSQRKLSRKEKGSANFRKNKRKLAKIHEHIAERRKHNISNAVTELVEYLKSHGFCGVVIRKYDIQGMIKKIAPVPDGKPESVDKVQTFKRNGRGFQKEINKKLAQGAMGMLSMSIKEKLTNEGLHVFEFDANKAKTTEKCSVCGSEDIVITKRVFTCKKCRHTEDIDVNAAKNTLKYFTENTENQGIVA